jgi:hypothetical protein
MTDRTFGRRVMPIDPDVAVAHAVRRAVTETGREIAPFGAAA